MNMNSVPSVLIIVLNWMKFDDTINCVQSLQKLNYANFEIFVIDNDSPNDSFEQLKTNFPTVNIVKTSKNNGYAAGNKIGVDYAISRDFELIWILNNDCTVRPDALTQLVEGYKRNGEALYSNLTLMSENPDVIHYAGTYEIDEEPHSELPTYDKLKGKLLADHKDTLVEKAARIYGHSMLIPMAVIRKYGFMDTKYFLFFEETDFCLSLHNKGVPSVFIPQAIVIHKSTSTFSLSPKMKYIGHYYGNRNKVLFEKRFRKTGYQKDLAKKGGIKGLLKSVLSFYFSSKTDALREEFYVNLGLLHGVIGIRGRIIAPESFIK
jgi:GT2 family glycosyltransferase